MPPKRQGQAFNVLFEQADAVARFQTISAKSGPAGRLYALAALQLLAKAEADRVVEDPRAIGAKCSCKTAMSFSALGLRSTSSPW